MEQFPSIEQKKIEKQEVLERLRLTGMENEETMALVLKWRAEREEEVMKENTPKATIILNIEMADLYVAAGDKDGALESLQDAHYQAIQENETELQERIATKIQEIEAE